MKKNVILATALAFAAFAASAGITAAADAAPTEYPTEFISTLEFTALTDYAIFGDSYAFAEGTKLYIVAPDEVGDVKLNSAEGFDCSVEITSLGYDEDGNLYIENAEGKTYKYPDLTQTVEHEFGSETNVVIGDYTYFIVAGTLHWKFSDVKMGDFGAGYSRLKSYTDDGGQTCAYVIKDNALFRLDGEDQTEVVLEYTDFGAANSIPTGDAGRIITEDYELKKVIVQPTTAEGGDTYCTEVDLGDLSTPYFTAGRTLKQTMVHSALIIGEVGNAAIIVKTDENGETKSYITLTSALEFTDDALTSSPDFASAYILETTKLYSRPYMCGATEIATLDRGARVTALEKLALDFADSKISYYKISCEQDGQLIEGYIAANYLTPYSFAGEGSEQEKLNDEEGFGDEVRNVVISLAIVALMLIAVGYMTFVLTKGKENKRRNSRTQNRDDYY